MLGIRRVADRAIFFVDGNNLYHGLKDAGATGLYDLDYCKIAKKLAGPRAWCGLRYYVGQVKQEGDGQLYADQRRFVSQLRAQSPLISVHFGRIETRRKTNEAAVDLKAYLQGLGTRLDEDVYKDLWEIVTKHSQTELRVEKAVDVMLAVDMVVMAMRNEYDAAYLISADGDYTHAVSEVKGLGKKVFGASAGPAQQLTGVCNAYIPTAPSWFGDCYKDAPAPPKGPPPQAPRPSRPTRR